MTENTKAALKTAAFALFLTVVPAIIWHIQHGYL